MATFQENWKEKLCMHKLNVFFSVVLLVCKLSSLLLLLLGAFMHFLWVYCNCFLLLFGLFVCKRKKILSTFVHFFMTIASVLCGKFQLENSIKKYDAKFNKIAKFKFWTWSSIISIFKEFSNFKKNINKMTKHKLIKIHDKFQ